MSDRIVSADEARALREAAQPGPWFAAEVVSDGQSEVIVGRSASTHIDVIASTNSSAALIAAAPDLARTVEALHAEVERFRAAFRREEDRADALAQSFDDLVLKVWRAATGDTHEGHASVEALLDAVAGLRESVEGRTVPPTVEEAQVHIDAGGSFRMVSGLRSFIAETVLAVDLGAEDFHGARWWALDADRRPCAWPVVGGVR